VQRLLIGLTSVLFLGVALFLSFCQSPEKQAEKKSSPTQAKFANLAPEVGYTGTQSCVSCHKEIYQEYLKTGKGRSFHEPSRDRIIEDFSKAHVYDQHANLHYRAYWRGPELWISEYRLQGKDTIHSRAEKVQYVVGSGNQTRSYIREENGYLFEMPITWYVSKAIWDMSPGYENGMNSRFDRPIGDMCMSCHNSGEKFEANSVNRFQSVGRGIGCEKCHGPGEAHVNAMLAGDSVDTRKHTDFTIVNPKHLPIQLQFDVCRQCHLEGITVPKENKHFTEFRPGQPLADYWDVFIPVAHNTAQFGFASHAERLQMSPCFIQSKGKLTCNTCHDPHKPLPENEVLLYNSKCQTCHQPEACDIVRKEMTGKSKAKPKAGIPKDAVHSGQAKEFNCIGCHMPKSGTTDIPHVTSHDHFIRKTIGDTTSVKLKEGELKEFRSFTSAVKPEDRAALLANMLFFEQADHNQAYLQRIARYVNALDVDSKVKYAYLSKQSLPADLAQLQPASISNAYTAFYLAELHQQAQKPGLPWVNQAVKLAPSNVDFLAQLARYQVNSGQSAEAKATYSQIVKLQPTNRSALTSLSYLYLLEGNHDKALELVNRAIKSDPDFVLARENRVTILLQKGNLQEGLTELDRLIARNPGNERYRALRSQVVEQL
jgi:hypothetical protein